jgi:hypothetical protein
MYIPNGSKIYQNFPFQDPPKFTQMVIFWFENITSGNPGKERGKNSACLGSATTVVGQFFFVSTKTFFRAKNFRITFFKKKSLQHETYLPNQDNDLQNFCNKSDELQMFTSIEYCATSVAKSRLLKILNYYNFLYAWDTSKSIQVYH